jgi:hypothetical protein
MPAETPPHVTLLIPGLLGLPDAVVPATLTRLLARADRYPASLPPGFEMRLFRLFGIATPAGQDLPVAAVTRLADMGVVDRDWWVRADPVYLEPRRDGLVLHPVRLTTEEAGHLATELAAALATDGWLLRAPCAQRWYLKPPGTPQLATTPLAEVIGRDIRDFLPQGPDYRVWHTRLNEIQILLHTTDANAAREARGECPANSVWFWGGGCLPEAGPAGFGQVWSDEPLGQGLARLCGLPARAMPADAATWLKLAEPAPAALLVFDGLQAAARDGDGQAWAAGLNALIEQWLVPLRRAVERGAIAGLTLLADTGPRFEYRRAHRLRFWRRAQPLSVYRAA